MPNYKTHDAIGYFSAPVLGITTYAVTDNLNAALVLTASYIFSTLFLSPDLDLDSHIYKRWSILRFIWHPYKQIIPHRSVFSHSGPFSATLRIVYLFTWLTVLASALYFLAKAIGVPDLSYRSSVGFLVGLETMFVCFWLGAVLADTVHCVADFMTG